MEKRHSSPAHRAPSTRPKVHRKRSNSFPIVDALGCSTPEAELLLAEGRAAIRSRHASIRRRGRRKQKEEDIDRTYRPKDHIKYLLPGSEDAIDGFDFPRPSSSRTTRHSRIPSTATDGSSSTIVASSQPHTEEPRSATSTTSDTSTSDTSQLGDYSAHLAKFIQARLNSIPSYQTVLSPRSCPDLSVSARSPPQSPRSIKRHLETLELLEMPPVRPPLQSAFSAWSSTDDERDDVLPLPSAGAPRSNSRYTPSILGYYQNANGGSFLLPSSPESSHDEVKGFSFTDAIPADLPSPSHSTSIDDDAVSSDISAQPQLSASSAPSFSSTSTASYFDHKRPAKLAPHVRDRIMAAVSPQPYATKMLTVLSPFEGNAIANVHDVFVESQQRVVIEGMSFDMVRDFVHPPDQGMSRIPTPC
ncbi:hypothetical protein EJ04DRAFT_507357 [Polyplosphaeria fusca]|uniref:Uncharacterized protein n=1 Tax=Polyplosphaeria fusca TaxID=682080 RepID=A0A9P4R8C7_9PLEO|nr:hypothetical protein EJ04DRAFT_507357 [Polyplosphaeria fusca]